MNKGVGISNKSVTSSHAPMSKQPQVVSQTKTVTNAKRTTKVSRYVKLSVASILILGILGTQLMGRVSANLGIFLHRHGYKTQFNHQSLNQ